jgi:hypothetical protein
VHVLLIGASLFLLFGLTQEPDGKKPNRIVMRTSQVEQLAVQFSRTWLRPPTQDELNGLIEITCGTRSVTPRCSPWDSTRTPR